MMFIYLFSRRVTARLKVNIIRKSNVSKIPPQYRRAQLKIEMICPLSRAPRVSASWKNRRTFISGRRQIH